MTGLNNGPAYVYGLFDPITKTIFYVGVTKDPDSVAGGHASDPGRPGYLRANRIRDQGAKVEAKILAYFPTRNQAHRCEHELVQIYSGLINRQRSLYQLGAWHTSQAAGGG